MSKKKRVRIKGSRKGVGRSSSSGRGLREDFEVFAKGVERLEQLRKELNNLNSKGYEDEASSIRSKLNNVSYIPEIETELRELKLKISGKYRRNKRKGKKKTDVHEKIHRKIKELEKEIDKRKRIGGKRQLNKKEVNLVKDIPRIESQLRSFKEFIADQKQEEERKKQLLRKVDPGVNFLVDNKFNLTLNEIKAELSKKLNEKETLVQKQLQDDLEARKKNFEMKYKDLENQFEKKYKDKITSSLNKEIKTRFNDALQERVRRLKRILEADAQVRLDKRKAELDIIEIRAMDKLTRKKQKEVERKVKREQYAKFKDKQAKVKVTRQHLIALRENLNREFSKKSRGLEREHHSKMNKEKAAIRKHYEEEVLANKAKLNNQLHFHLTNEVGKLHRDYEQKKKEAEDRVKDAKRRIEQERGALARIRNNLNSEVRKVRKDEEAYKRELRERLEKEKQEAIKRTVANESASIRNRLRAEFNNKMKAEIKAKQAEFEKRKADLALEIQKKAKLMFS